MPVNADSRSFVMTSSERRKAAEGRFIQQQRTISCKQAFFWFTKRLILFIILFLYTVIGAYTFEVCHFHLDSLSLLSPVHTATENGDCRRKVRLSQKTATDALFCDSRRFLRQIVAAEMGDYSRQYGRLL